MSLIGGSIFSIITPTSSLYPESQKCYHISSLSYISIGSFSLLFRLYHRLSAWDTRVRFIASFAHLLVVEPSSALKKDAVGSAADWHLSVSAILPILKPQTHKISSL